MTNKTKSALGTENSANFADNTTGAITPAILRSTMQDFIDSMATQLDQNTWTASAGAQLFNGGFTSSGLSTFNASVAFNNPVAVASTATFVFSPTSLTVAGSTSGSTILVATAAASGTLTLPATTDTIVGKNTTDILTNKTINTGSTSTLQVGSITLSIGQYPATNTNDSATSGNFGEYVESIVTSGSPQSLTSASVKTITSITVTAGDWDVSGSLAFAGAGGVTYTFLEGSLSTSTNTVDQTVGRNTQISVSSQTPGQTPVAQFPIGPVRFSFTASANSIFLVANQIFSIGTMTGYGLLRARRAR